MRRTELAVSLGIASPLASCNAPRGRLRPPPGGLRGMCLACSHDVNHPLGSLRVPRLTPMSPP